MRKRVLPYPLIRRRRYRSWIAALSLPLLAAITAAPANAQFFVEITDTLNPVVTEPSQGSYAGAAWVDVDNDGLLDLFLAGSKAIFHNQGGGAFTRVGAVIKQQGFPTGTTWADYNNDGLLDCFVTGPEGGINKGSSLYRNEGSLTFQRINTGDIGDHLNIGGWGCAFADFDNDAWVDVVVAAANGFGVNHENRLFHNNGDGSFTRIDSTEITNGLDAYTIPTWSDYDLDGDADLFIGSGAISTLHPDNLYRNNLVENGYWSFDRITTPPIGTDDQDGQTWNWIDYDNDGDLDAYLTNYRASLENRFYRNDGGAYVQLDTSSAGTIANSKGSALGNTWADFDNDGDLDCIVTRDATATNLYYTNNNDGTFTRDTTIALGAGNGPHYGAIAGDYDNDGDLDMFITGFDGPQGLFRNDMAAGNAWINVKCVGAGAPGGSNVAAVGARVRAKATIGGSAVWQQREVSAQNAFNSMSMLNVHFGFGDAAVIDSLLIDWPAGGTETMTSLAVNQFIAVNEQIVTGLADDSPLPRRATLLPNVPNPFNPVTKIAFDIPARGLVSLRIFDPAGREVRTLLEGRADPGRHTVTWHGRNNAGAEVSSGIYFYRIEADEAAGAGERYSETRKMVLVK